MQPQPVSIHVSFSDHLGLFFKMRRGQGAIILLIIGTVLHWLFISNSDWRFFQFVSMKVGKVQGIVNSSEEMPYSVNGDYVMQTFYSYQVDGTSYFGDVYSLGSYFEDGATVKVEYLESTPHISRIWGTRNAPFGPWLLLLWIVPILGVLFLQSALRKVYRTSRLLAHGYLTEGKRVQDMLVEEFTRVTFSYEVNNAKNETQIDTPFPNEYGLTEPIIFTGDPPKDSRLCKELSTGVIAKIESKLGVKIVQK